MSNIGIEDLDIGISKRGMDEYKKSLKTIVLKNTGDKLDDADQLIEAIKAMWQGESCEAFLKDFKTARNNMKKDLEAEYEDLEARLNELEGNYFEQDRRLYDSIY